MRNRFIHFLKYRLRCRLNLHLWSYGGHKAPCSDGGYCIMGKRVCILCYYEQWWRPGWWGKGKARWTTLKKGKNK